MKWKKSTILIISLMATSVIIFNNLVQLSEKILLPSINQKYFNAFILTLIVVFVYAIVNRKELFN
ncbi:MAG: hypothetical protein AABY22_23325 [Nanoarchaeota archaeon]